MSKNKNDTPVAKQKKKINIIRLLATLVNLFIIAAIVGVIALVINQPGLVKDKIREFIGHEQPAAYSGLQNSIDSLTSQVNHLTEQNSYFMNLKADSSVVLSMTERLDNIDKIVSRLSLVSNDSAVALTAALLVKDAASGGRSFQYEAEILRELSNSQTQIEEAVGYIYSMSLSPLPSDWEIINRFDITYDKILDEMTPKEQNLSWQEKITNKAKQYVQIERTDVLTEKGYDKLETLSKIKSLVNNGNFADAVNQLELPENKPIFDNENIQNWLQETKNKLKFYQSISEISAHYLILLKVDSIKN